MRLFRQNVVKSTIWFDDKWFDDKWFDDKSNLVVRLDLDPCLNNKMNPKCYRIICPSYKSQNRQGRLAQWKIVCLSIQQS